VDRRLLLVAAWAACALLAAGLGFGAASLVGDAIGDSPSASADQATGPTGTPGPTTSTSARPSSAASSTPSRTSASPTRRPTTAAPAVHSGSRSTTGGVVFASCRAGLVRVSPSPAPGWRLDSWTSGSVPTAGVEFRNGTATVEVRVRCGSGGPVFSVETGTSGGGDGGGDGGGSTGGPSDG